MAPTRPRRSRTAAGALAGNYPNPSLHVTGGDNGASACKSGEPLRSLSAAGALTCAGVSPSGTAGGDLTGTYPNPTIAAGAVTTSTFAPDATAPNTTELAGAPSSDYGAVLSGRVDGLGTGSFLVWGAPSGISTATGSSLDIDALSPDLPLRRVT